MHFGSNQPNAGRSTQAVNASYQPGFSSRVEFESHPQFSHLAQIRPQPVSAPFDLQGPTVDQSGRAIAGSNSFAAQSDPQAAPKITLASVQVSPPTPQQLQDAKIGAAKESIARLYRQPQLMGFGPPTYPIITPEKFIHNTHADLRPSSVLPEGSPKGGSKLPSTYAEAIDSILKSM